MKKRTSISILLAIVLIAVAVTSVFAAPAGQESEQKNIYLLTKILTNQYWTVLADGAKAAAADNNVNLVVSGLTTEAEIEVQLFQFEMAVEANADAIIIGATDSTVLAEPISEAYKAGIPVILVDTMARTEDYSVALLTDNLEAGRMAGEKLLAMMKESGLAEDAPADIAIQVSNIGSKTTADRIKGLNDYWAENAPKAWTVLNDDIRLNDGDMIRGIENTQIFLTAYPNLKAVFAPNASSTVGFITGLNEAGRDDIIVMGFDFSDEMAAHIQKEGVLAASVVQKQYKMGYDGVTIALDLINGGTVEDKIIYTGEIIVDKDNIDAPEIQEFIHPTAE